MLKSLRVDKRPATRYDFRCEAQFCKRGSNAPLRGFLSDISLSGCYFETITPEPVGTPVEVSFQATGASVRLCGVVRVVHPNMGMALSSRISLPRPSAPSRAWSKRRPPAPRNSTFSFSISRECVCHVERGRMPESKHPSAGGCAELFKGVSEIKTGKKLLGLMKDPSGLSTPRPAGFAQNDSGKRYGGPRFSALNPK